MSIQVLKSQILLEIRPLDSTVDLNDMKHRIMELKLDGLTWGTSTTKEIGYQINSLLITGIVEDLKVSSKDIEDLFIPFEDISSLSFNLWNKI